jgi:hypothetical protein
LPLYDLDRSTASKVETFFLVHGFLLCFVVGNLR